MKYTVPTLLALALTAGQAQAGFFDFLKPAEEKAPEVQSAPAAAANTTSDMVSTGINLASSLIPQLTNSLSISEEQATGGLGSIMQYAKSSLSSDQAKQLGSNIPGLETIMAAAPSISGGNSGLSNALGQLGGMGGSLGDVAQKLGGLDLLNQQFEALGLSTDMIGQIAQIAMQFFSSNDPQSGNLLQQALGSLTQS